MCIVVAEKEQQQRGMVGVAGHEHVSGGREGEKGEPPMLGIGGRGEGINSALWDHSARVGPRGGPPTPPQAA